MGQRYISPFESNESTLLVFVGWLQLDAWIRAFLADRKRRTVIRAASGTSGRSYFCYPVSPGLISGKRRMRISRTQPSGAALKVVCKTCRRFLRGERFQKATPRRRDHWIAERLPFFFDLVLGVPKPSTFPYDILLRNGLLFPLCATPCGAG